MCGVDNSTPVHHIIDELHKWGRRVALGQKALELFNTGNISTPKNLTDATRELITVEVSVAHWEKAHLGLFHHNPLYEPLDVFL